MKHKLISVFLKLKSTLKQELGKDMSSQLADRINYAIEMNWLMGKVVVTSIAIKSEHMGKG